MKVPVSIIIFNRPGDVIEQKWVLASQRDISHVVLMPHITKKLRQVTNFLKMTMEMGKKKINEKNFSFCFLKLICNFALC